MLSLAGSPPVAERLGLRRFHFVNRQIDLTCAGASLVMLIVGFLPRRAHVRRMALLVYVVGLALMVAALFFGAEVKGARRWMPFGGHRRSSRPSS